MNEDHFVPEDDENEYYRVYDYYIAYCGIIIMSILNCGNKGNP